MFYVIYNTHSTAKQPPSSHPAHLVGLCPRVLQSLQRQWSAVTTQKISTSAGRCVVCVLRAVRGLPQCGVCRSAGRAGRAGQCGSRRSRRSLRVAQVGSQVSSRRDVERGFTPLSARTISVFRCCPAAHTTVSKVWFRCGLHHRTRLQCIDVFFFWTFFKFCARSLCIEA